MPVTVVMPTLFPTALLNDATVAAAPTARDDAGPSLRVPDVVVFSTAPFRALAELAAAGLRNLAVLLPALEQAVEDHSLEPLAHLVKAADTAVRQVADGHVALLAAGPDRLAAALPSAAPPRASAPSETPQPLRTLARQIGATIEPMPEPAPNEAPNEALRAVARQVGATALERQLLDIGDPKAEPAQRWIAEANHLLHRTGDALEQATALLPPPEVSLGPTALSVWAIEIAAAQTQIAATLASLSSRSAPPRRATASPLFPLDLLPKRLSGATSVIGTAVILASMSLATGLWSVCLALLGLGATVYWVWRIGRAAQGVSLDAAR